MLGQERDVLAAIAQRRHRDANHVEPVHQIEPEPPRGDLLSQVAVRRGDEPDVDASRDVLADTAHFAFLERAQHLGLRARRQLSDFVEEERPEM